VLIEGTPVGFAAAMIVLSDIGGPTGEACPD
jgi:hypothetical protein